MNGARSRPHGLLPAIATPLGADGAPDAARSIAHCRQLLAEGCDGVNLLGTTGAFASYAVDERIGLMEAYAAAALPLQTMLVGTGAAAFADAVALTTRAVSLGFGGALVIPPFYFKALADDDVFAFYARLIERVAHERLRVYLYHFPALSGVPFTVPLVERLVAAYPATVAGLKDSAGDAAFEAALHRALPGFDVFPASEAGLLAARRAGYAGCISATLNLTARLAARVWHGPDDPACEAAQATLAAERASYDGLPLVATVHARLAVRYGDEAWRAVPPPLGSVRDPSRIA